MSSAGAVLRAAVVVVLLLTSCAQAVPSVAAPPRTAARVAASADGLTLDGRPWWPSGFNAYQLATDWSVNQGCGAMVDLDRYFAALPPRSVTRFDAFQALAIDGTTGTLNFAPMDAVMDAARTHGQLVIPVLAAQDGACEDEQFKDRYWYAEGWRDVADARAVVSFEEWVTRAVDRWRGDAALAAWEVVGEPEPGVCGESCDWTDRTCPADAASVLRRFVDDTGALVRSLDASTPITAGLTGGGQCGTQGDEYRDIAASPYVDIVQYHDYGADGVPLPGDRWNGLERRLVQASEMGKPLLVGEIGQNAGSCSSLDHRVENIETKVAGQRAAGTAGFLLWAFVPDPRPGECTFDIGYDDPLWSTVTRLGSG
ncbi:MULTISPECIES: beta-mannosidase [Nocardiaceae]|uniref:Beta-mannosidase n=1 Tax=Rhodococcoides corynebacterioides TaxID=53972 RepID=A0ABS2KWB2_9NOCA|nr:MULTISPECIES: beta-mannosidase [Rhodococcus]MBM7416234.1 hypothetical protein [Rhodococcus corynebacterioides]MBP1114487.1 hypothetical protein [Rhodococcus sp. PvP016]